MPIVNVPGEYETFMFNNPEENLDLKYFEENCKYQKAVIVAKEKVLRTAEYLKNAENTDEVFSILWKLGHSLKDLEDYRLVP